MPSATARQAAATATARGRKRSESPAGSARRRGAARGPGGGRGHGAAARCGGRRTRYRNSGPPATTMTIPTCSLGGPRDDASGDVRRQHQRGRQDRAVREQPAQVGAGEGADEVRHHQPDEDDRPAGRGRRPAQQRDRRRWRRRGPARDRRRARGRRRRPSPSRSAGGRAASAAASAGGDERQRRARWCGLCAAASDPTVQNRMRSRDAVSRSCTALT